MQSRTISLIGEKYDLIKNATVAVIGVGGVGGYVVEFLARADVENLIIVDYDKIDITNLNRQIIALQSNVGCYKVDEFAKRVKEINPNINLLAYRERLTIENVEKIVTDNIDYVVDAIDDVKNKVELIAFCKERNIPIISSMGVGNRYKPCTYEVVDIFATKEDKLAKVLRKRLKDRNIKSLDVVCSNSKTEVVKDVIGSISYLPPMAASVISCHVINKLIDG